MAILATTMVQVSVESLVTFAFLGGGMCVALFVLGYKAFTSWLDTDIELRVKREENVRLKAEIEQLHKYKCVLIEKGFAVI